MSAPFAGKAFVISQPDGSELRVLGWGDQYRVRMETPDGAPVTRNSATGFYEVGATEAATRDTRASAESVAGQHGRDDHKGILDPSSTRWQQRRKSAAAARAGAALGGLAPPQHRTVGKYVGLCLLVQFPDVPGTIAPAEVEALCNRAGYSGFGNNGSVRDYFLDNSAKKLDYSNLVLPWYTAPHPRAYYTDPDQTYPVRAQELIEGALRHHVAAAVDFGPLSADAQEYVFAINVFYAGQCVNAWGKGLWPHAYHLDVPLRLGEGRQAFDYQITDMGDELTLGTFCHENGHMICDFPDLYDYGNESQGVGAYCLMCAGANIDERNPTQIGAYLKYKAGWTDTIKRLTAGSYSADAGRNSFFLHSRDQSEYFIVENRQQSGRDAALPCAGLAIWHIDEAGNNNDEQHTPAAHYECSLVQADGRWDLEGPTGNYGDSDDLFAAVRFTEFGPATQPASHWWSGAESGLHLLDIGISSTPMSFRMS